MFGGLKMTMDQYNFMEVSQYYRRLDTASMESDRCYEITLLEGTFAGLKMLLTAKRELLAVCQLRKSGMADASMKAEEEMKETVNVILSSEELFASHLPAVKMTACGSVFIEKTGGGQHLVICGAGHVSIALIRIAKMVGFKITVIDDRPSFTNNARAAGADEVICEAFTPALKAMDDGDAPYFVVVTRGHQYDVDCMHEILKKKHSYIGMMGSRVRVKNLKNGLLNEGFDAALLDSVHMPIGLKIGAQTPEEIAVSIIAEIIECRRSSAKDYHYSRQMIDALCHNTSHDMSMALATIVVKKGCGPREAGTKMIVMEDGSLIGTIGGGCAEAAVIQKARYCMRNKSCALEHVDMTGREAAENGLVCGGVMEVFIQYLS